MRVNFDAPITNLAGEVFQAPAGNGPHGNPITKPMTLGWVVVEALLWYDPTQPNADSGEAKALSATLATLAYRGGITEVAIEHVAFIKSKVGANIAHPLVVGRAFDALEDWRPRREESGGVEAAT